MKNIIGYLLGISLVIGSLHAQIVVPGYPEKSKSPAIDIGVITTLADAVKELEDLQKDSLSLFTTIKVIEGLKEKPGANVTTLRAQGVQVLKELENVVSQANEYATYAKKFVAKSPSDITNREKVIVIMQSIEKDLSDAQQIVK